jgi:hypothetical protein
VARLWSRAETERREMPNGADARGRERRTARNAEQRETPNSGLPAGNPPSGVCAFWRLRLLASAPYGVCALWHFAPFALSPLFGDSYAC